MRLANRQNSPFDFKTSHHTSLRSCRDEQNARPVISCHCLYMTTRSVAGRSQEVLDSRFIALLLLIAGFPPSEPSSCQPRGLFTEVSASRQQPPWAPLLNLQRPIPAHCHCRQRLARSSASSAGGRKRSHRKWERAIASCEWFKLWWAPTVQLQGIYRLRSHQHLGAVDTLNFLCTPALGIGPAALASAKRSSLLNPRESRRDDKGIGFCD